MKNRKYYQNAINLIDENLKTNVDISSTWYELLLECKGLLEKEKEKYPEVIEELSPMELEIRKHQCCAMLKNFFDQKTFEKIMKYIEETDFLYAPASTKYHGAVPGGLYDHSYDMVQELVYLTKALNLKWEKPRSPIIVGLFHDLCKVNKYRISEDGTKYEYIPKNYQEGHGSLSVEIIKTLINDLTKEEELCILYHMGAYEMNKWKEYDEAIRQYPNVLYTHTADMHSSKINNK